MSNGREQKPPWRHHYIPEFYLKRWTDRTGRLVEFSRPYSKIRAKRVYPRQTGFQRRLYAMPGMAEEVAHRFETEFFSPVDSRAADALATMEAGDNKPRAAERDAWARFIISLLFRNPENVQDARLRLIDRILVTDAASERRYRKAWKPGLPRNLKDAMAQWAAGDDEMMVRRSVKLIAEMSNNERIRGRILKMQWGTLHFGFNTPAFLTSDRPIILEYGLDDPQCYILMPIGPKLLFYAVNSEERYWDIAGFTAGDMLTFVNETVTQRAKRFVYGMSDHMREFVDREIGTDTQPTYASRANALRMLKEQRNNIR